MELLLEKELTCPDITMKHQNQQANSRSNANQDVSALNSTRTGSSADPKTQPLPRSNFTREDLLQMIQKTLDLIDEEFDDWDEGKAAKFRGGKRKRTEGGDQ